MHGSTIERQNRRHSDEVKGKGVYIVVTEPIDSSPPVVNTILHGDALTMLRTLSSGSVHCIVTSPPYWGLRDYGTDGQVWGGAEDCAHTWGAPTRTAWANEVAGATSDPGKNTVAHQRPKETGPYCSVCGAWRGELGAEPTPEEYVAHLVAVLREARRVLRDDGTLWLNLGDSYAANPSTSLIPRVEQSNGTGVFRIPSEEHVQARRQKANRLTAMKRGGLKHKDLVGIPWRVAFALQADGWWLRSDIIWAKPNPMPESVTDRPTRSHEYLFLLAKSARYYYDAAAIREQPAASSLARIGQKTFATQTGGPKDYGATESGGAANRSMRRTLEHFAAKQNGQDKLDKQRGHGRRHAGFNDRWDDMSKEQQQALGSNKRDVWRVATRPYSGAHFATFPPALIEPCILAGCPVKTCETCGAPWERVIEREQVDAGSWSAQAGKKRAQAEGDRDRKRANGSVFSDSSVFNTGKLNVAHTIGQRPTCGCTTNTGAGHGVALDPFMGAGTVAVVARRHSRSYLGIELNAAYIALAEARIAQERQPVLWTSFR